MVDNKPLEICGPGADEDLKAQLEADDTLDVTVDVQLRKISASVYDKAFFLMGLFHIIEWIRTIVLLSSTILGGEMLIVIYQVTSINAIFGFVAYVFAHYALLMPDGKACSTKQPARAQFLTAEIIFFYVVYGISILFVLAFPKMAFELAHGAWRKREQKR